MLRDRAPDARQRPGERAHAAELGFVAHFAPARVVAVLLASARVAPGRLQMAILAWADPYLLPRGRDGECLDSRQHRLAAHCAAIRVLIAKTVARAPTRNTGRHVAHVAQP